MRADVGGVAVAGADDLAAVLLHDDWRRPDQRRRGVRRRRGFWKSTDAGKTWATMRTPHGDNHDIWINPKDGNVMIQSNDGGANVSTDGGRTWSTQMNQPTSEIYGVWMDNEFPYNVYGAQQDNSTLIITSQANPYDTQAFRGGPGCETGPIMPHPKDPNIVYGSCKGQYEWMNLKTGQSKRYWVGAQSLYGNPGKDLILRFQRVSPMATSPHDPEIVYYGSQYLHRTRDKGVTWEKISTDLTANDPCCQGASGEPITRDVTGEEFYSTLYAITESPLERGVIWTGSNDGPFNVTRDNGKTWTNVTPKDLPPGGRVAWIDASAHRRGSAYFAVYRYLLGDYAPYLYKTDDYGKTWTKLTDGKNGIARDNPTRVVREDPTAKVCCMPAPSSACSSRSTTARTGRASSSTCRSRPSTTSRSTRRTSSWRRRAARCGYSTTSRRCNRSRRRCRPRARSSSSRAMATRRGRTRTCSDR
jgi:photosystem II stability/assembly factor-like uncharacterized protein